MDRAKFLVACTPNGGISYISDVYVGSISDVELTKKSGFLTTLEDKPGERAQYLPPFMEGRQQLPADQVMEGRKIASLDMHVERAIGRIKTFKILQETIPNDLARLTNQVVHVSAYLSNFHPALVPPPELTPENDVETYFDTNVDSDDFSSD
jgi:hypothetical protein